MKDAGYRGAGCRGAEMQNAKCRGVGRRVQGVGCEMRDAGVQNSGCEV